MILIAVGANLPGPSGEPPLATCQRAVGALAALAGLRLHAVSRWYRSRPVPACAQPDYVNGVVSLAGEAAPDALLRRLQAIERDAGRVRGVRNAARPLDLDIIDMDGRLRDAPDPVLPHPRAALRAFVLLPLRDVAPSWVEPRRLQPVDRLLAELGEGSAGGCGEAVLPLDWPIPY